MVPFDLIRRRSQVKPGLGSRVAWEHPLAQGLQGLWLYNEGGGLIVRDCAGVSGTGDATITGNTSIISWGQGRDGSAISCAGNSGAYITSGSSTIYAPPSVTYVCLVQSLTADSNFRRVIENSNGSFLTQNSSNAWAWAPHGSEYTSVVTPLVVGEWAMLVATWDGVATTGTLYKNGIAYQQIGSGSALSGSSATIVMCGDSGSGQAFLGKMLMGAFYNRVLSQAEAQWLTAEPYAMVAPQRRYYAVPTSTIAESISDTLVLSDALAIGYGDKTSDTIALSDALAFAFVLNLTLTDSLTLPTDSFQKQLSTALVQSDSLTLSDAFSVVIVGGNFADQLTFADANKIGYGDLIHDSLTIADSFSALFPIVLSLSDQIIFGDLFQPVVPLSLSVADQLVVADAFQYIRGIAFVVSDQFPAASGALTGMNWGLLVAGVSNRLPMMDALVVGLNLNLNDQIVLSDSAFVQGPKISLTFADSLVQTDNLDNTQIIGFLTVIITDLPDSLHDGFVMNFAGNAGMVVAIGDGINVLSDRGFNSGVGTVVIIPVIPIVVTGGIGAGDVSLVGDNGLIGIITEASGEAEIFFFDILYRYANLDLPFSPNDPGLAYTYDNSAMVKSVPLAARFFNLLDERSDPLFFDAACPFPSTAVPSVTGLFECLDVRLSYFGQPGAVGDGVTDDTAAVQRTLDQAWLNYQAKIRAGLANPNQTLSVPGATAGYVSPAQIAEQAYATAAGTVNDLGSTIVCIPSGVFCKVFPRTFDFANYGGAPAPSDPFPKDHLGLCALFIDDGVSIECDGALILGVDEEVLKEQAAQNAAMSGNHLVDTLWILENRQAFVGGPWTQGQFNPQTWDYSIQTLEAGPRNTSIRVFGEGIFDCGSKVNGNAMDAEFVTGGDLNPVRNGAIRFCKCDQSQIEGITVQNFHRTSGIYWGHSEKTTTSGVFFQHQYGAGQQTFGSSGIDGNTDDGSAALVLDAIRLSEAFNNQFLDTDCCIEEWACFHTDIHDNQARQCGVPCQGAHMIIDQSLAFFWTFSEELHSDGNRYGNHYSWIRGQIWQPDMFIVNNRIMTPTSYIIGNHIWLAIPNLPTFGLGIPEQPGFYAGITGATEPNWGSAGGLDPTWGGPYVADAIVNVKNALIGIGSQQGASEPYFANGFFMPMADINNGATVTLYKNGVAMGAGDWTYQDGTLGAIGVVINGTLAADDVITCDLVSQIRWVDLGAAYFAYPIAAGCMQVLGGQGNGMLVKGIQILGNQISDNYQDGIVFSGMDHGQIVHNTIQRNTGAGIRDQAGGMAGLPGIESVGVTIKDNTVGDNAAGQNVDVPPAFLTGGATVDNPGVVGSPAVNNGVGGLLAMGEVPVGVVNGVNATFTIANDPVPTTSLQLFAKRPTDGGYLLLANPTQYTVTALGTITIVTPATIVPTGTLLLANYNYV